MRKSQKRSVVVGAAMLAAAAVAAAGDGPTLETKVARAIVFKDGYAMVVKSATGKPDDAGQAVIEGVPQSAVLGAFWVVPSRGKLRSLVARQRIIPKQGRTETEKRLLEVRRTLKAVRHQGYDYSKIEKMGTLRVTSYKKEPVTLYITCQLGGNATKASDDGEITITDFQAGDWKNVTTHPALNGHSTIRWQLDLKPGQTKWVTCHYEYYLRM